MRLTDLGPEFVRYLERDGHKYLPKANTIGEAQGLIFLCPKCLKEKGCSIGVHSVICWTHSVPEHAQPRPGRWNMIGTGFHDLSLEPSVQLIGGCSWHGFIKNGEVSII